MLLRVEALGSLALHVVIDFLLRIGVFAVGLSAIVESAVLI
jgi:hypothetical protein